jgi:predicted acylesterase/phospholipase RssA
MSNEGRRAPDFTKTTKYPPHAAKQGRTPPVSAHAARLVQRKEHAGPIVQPMLRRGASRARSLAPGLARASSSSAIRLVGTPSVRTEVPEWRYFTPRDLSQARTWLDKIERDEELDEAERFFKPWGIEVPRVEVGPPQYIWEVRNAGGGAKGPLLLPVKQALDEHGIHPISYTGSSVGTIPSMFSALGMSHEEISEAMTQFKNVLNMPHWEKWRDRDLADVIDDGPEGGGAGLAHLFASAAHTAVALWKQGGRLSDRTRLEALLRESVGSHLRRSGLSRHFVDPYDPKLGELAKALFKEPESAVGLLSFPVTDSLTNRMVRVDPFTMPHVSIIDAILGATAHPALFNPYEVNGRMVWDGGATQNVGFPGFFGPRESLSTNFLSTNRKPGRKRTPYPFELLQVGTKATGLPFWVQHAIDNDVWSRGGFGAPVPVFFDPSRISTIKEASELDVQNMSARVHTDASNVIKRYLSTDPKLRIEAIEELMRRFAK